MIIEGNTEEKKEGAFCVWTWDELKQLLGDKHVEDTDHSLFDVFVGEYNVKEGGNVDPRGDPHGELVNQNVLTKIPTNTPLISDVDKQTSALREAHNILFTERLKRPRPGLDIKILTSWNGLLISGICSAAAATQNKQYSDTAVRAGDFLINNLWNSETRRLLRCVYGSGEDLANLDIVIDGFVDDYCMTVKALLDLYQLTLDEKWLKHAVDVQTAQDELFLDSEHGGYFTSRDHDEEIVIRLKDDQDGAEPSSNSVSAMNLYILGRILNNSDYTDQGDKIIKLYHQRLEQLPHALPAMVEAFLFNKSDPLIVVITGSSDSSNNPLLHHLQTNNSLSTVIIRDIDFIRNLHPGLSSVEQTSATGAFIINTDGSLSPHCTNTEQLIQQISLATK